LLVVGKTGQRTVWFSKEKLRQKRIKELKELKKLPGFGNIKWEEINR